MKSFRYTLTVNVFIQAEDEESAEGKFEEMAMDFVDPDTNEPLEVELIDWDVSDLGEVDSDTDDFGDDD